MKRFLFLLFLIFFINSYGQSYNVKFKLNVRPPGGAYGDGCRNDIKVRIFYRIDGQYKNDVIFDKNLNGGGGEYKTSRILRGRDLLITKVHVSTSRNWRRFIGGCGGNGSFNGSTRITQINNRCSVLLTGSSLARWWNTSLGIDIKPMIDLSFAGEKSKNIVACENSGVSIKSNFPGSQYSFYRWEFADIVNGEKVPTEAYKKHLSNVKGLLSLYSLSKIYRGFRWRILFSRIAIHSASKMLNTIISNPRVSSGVKSRARSYLRTLQQEKTKLLRIRPSYQAVRLFDRILRILARRIATFYDGVITNDSFRTESSKYKPYRKPIWRPITSKNGQSRINLRLSDLYANAADRKKALNNVKINIRLNPPCNDNRDISNVVSVQFLPEPPKIAKKPTFNSPRCSYNEVSGFTLYFDRQLYANEKVNILLKKKNKAGVFVSDDDNSGIRSFQKVGENLYKYVWRNSPGEKIEGGDYRIEVSGDRPGLDGDKLMNCRLLSFPRNKNGFYTITVPKPVKFNATVEKHEACSGAKNGKIKITATGGTGSYYYSIDGVWSTKPFSKSIIISGKAPKVYSVLVKDSKKCNAVPNTSKRVSIKPKKKITHSASVVRKPSAPNKSDASIKISNLKGGTPTTNYYEYKILKNGNASAVIKSGRAYSSFTITGLPAGTHTIVYKDYNKCTQQYTLPFIENPSPITFRVSSTKPNCYNGKGTITISNVKGGYPSYKIVVIKIGGGNSKTFINVPKRGSRTVRFLPVGNYKVIVKDARLIAQKEQNVTIENQDELKISNIVSTPILCNGAKSKVTITASGGKSKQYEYAIYKSSNIVWQSSNVFSLEANPNIGYRFIIRDKQVKSCMSQISSVKKIPKGPPAIEVIGKAKVINNKIFGESKGQISLDIDGGTPGYIVTWKRRGDATFSKRGNPVTGLKAGFYSATIKDKKGCIIDSKKFSKLKDIEVKENPKLIATLKISKQIKCFGDLGSLEVTPKGGSGNYTYKWYKNNVLQSNQTSKQILNTGHGNYRVDVHDGSKKISIQKVLDQPQEVKFSVAKTDISCFGNQDGKIKLDIKGGSGNYLYSIDDRTSYQKVSKLSNYTITGLIKGDFNVWVKDDNGCEVKQAKKVTIKEPSEIKIVSSNITNCETTGGNGGAINISVVGGKGQRTYLWTKQNDSSFSKTSESISTLTAGMYTVSIKDKSNCEKQETFEVKEPLPIKVTISTANKILCYGKETGSIKAKVTGGYPINSVPSDFTYEWYYVKDKVLTQISESSDSLEGLKSGVYKVVVKDVKGSTASFSYNLEQPDEIKVKLISKQNVKCFGGATGKIDVDVTGGNSGYIYSWSKKGDVSFIRNTQDIDSLKIGNYVLTVKDANECVMKSLVFEITQPKSQLEVSNSVVNNLKGFQSKDGSISVTPKGGTPPYNYSWSKKGSNQVIGTNNKIQELKVGTYEVTIKDAKECSITKEYTLTQPDLLEIKNITQSKNILCYGDKNITLSAEVIGGVKPYRYAWYLKGNNTSITNTSQLENIGAGTYIIKITDANEIKQFKEYKVNQPTSLEIVLKNKKDVLCHGGNNGSISVEAKGGSGNYVYSWSHQATGNKLEGLSSGIYSVTIRDKNLCEITKSYKIDEPLSPLSVKSFTVQNVTGHGLSNGGIKVDLEGGTPPYKYTWSDDSGILSGEVTAFISSKKAGVYKLNIIDSNSCELSVAYEIKEPLPLEVNISKSTVLCKGNEGALTAQVKGGVKPYYYKWYVSSGDIVGKNKNLKALAGVYNVEVIDANANKKVITNIELAEPPLLEIESESKEDVICYGGSNGSISIEAKGGSGDYVYSWSHNVVGNKLEGLSAGVYSVTIRDKNLCEITKEYKIEEPEEFNVIETKLARPSVKGSNDGDIRIRLTGGKPPYTYYWTNKKGEKVLSTTTSLKSNRITSLTEGKYTVLITDSKNCSIKKTYNLATPGELLVSITQPQEISCNKGSNAILDVLTVGGVGGNNYKWFNVNDTTKVLSKKKQLVNVSLGKYYVIVDNAEGVEEKSSIFEVEEPTPIKLESKINHATCFEKQDGSIDIKVSGGKTKEYFYRYKNKDNTFTTWKKISDKNFTISNLISGEYVVQVRNSKGCYAVDSINSSEFNFEIKQPQLLSISEDNQLSATGFGLSNGSISLSVVGGTSPYTYIWKKSGEEIFKETTSSVNNQIRSLSAGVYKFSLIDSKGCSLEKEYTITQPLPLRVNIERLSVIKCKGSDSGRLSAKVSGGIKGYTYTWKSQAGDDVLGRGKELFGLKSGSYYVVVKDSKGNEIQSKPYILTDPEDLKVALSSSFVSCGKGNDWNVVSKVQGGTPPYTYLWNTGSSESSLSRVKSGTYKLIVADVYGCRTEKSIELTPPSELRVLEVTTVTPTCFGGNDGRIKLSVTGGTPPYTYKLNRGSSKIGNSNIITGLESGLYSVLITDIKGCSIVKECNVKNPNKIAFNLGEDVTLCKNQSYLVDATIDSGVSYKWSCTNGFSSNKPIVNLSKAGVYKVEVVTDLGCRVFDEIEVKESSEDIEATFIVSSQVYTNESFVLVNVSKTNNDLTTWVLPKGVKIIEKNNKYCEVLIDKEGEFELTLVTNKGNCQKFKTKKVLVLKNKLKSIDPSENKNSKQLISLVKLYPNPSSGNFKLDVELNNESNINVKFYKLNSTIIKSQTYSGKDIYNLKYDFDLASGVYFVLIETNKERVMKKIIIK